MKLGMIDLDTSHPGAWLPVIRDLGHDVVTVFDGGTIYPEGYAAEFAAQNKVPHVAKRPEEMIGRADAVIIHSCNWDLRLARAAAFVEAGVPVLLDKPVVGCMRDVETLRAWAKKGAVIAGGSSLRCCYETQAFLAKPASERGAVHAAFAGCGVDDFNYGIHAYANLFGLMGTGCMKARWLGRHVQDQYELTWLDGRRGIVTVGDLPWIPSYATAVTETGVWQFTPDLTRIYRALLERDLPILERKKPPMPIDDLLEPEIAAIAALASKRARGEPVMLAALTADHPGYDGAAFGLLYRSQRLPKYLAGKAKK